MNNFFKIASILTKIKITDLDKENIIKFLSEIKDNNEEQNKFFNYCKKWKVAPWVFTQLKNHGLIDYLNKTTQESFYEIHEKVKSENEGRNSEALKFLQEFKKENIDAIILKGNLFIHNVYKDTGYKKMNDFDILIHPEDWPKIQDIYFKMGYIPLGFGWSGEKQEAAKFSHTGISFISSNYKCITGTQWGLKSPTSNYNLDIKDAWNTATDFDFYDVKVKQLSPEYNLLHLILHMGVYKCGIRDCMDLYNFLLSEKNFNEDRFIEICKKSNAIDKAFFTLTLSNKCSGTISESLLEKLRSHKKSFLIRRLNSRLNIANKTGDFQTSYNDYFHDVEMNVFYFNLFPEFHRKLVFYFKIVGQIFFPNIEAALKLNDKTKGASIIDKLVARIKAPYFVFALLAEEIGLKITIILFIKLFFDLLISLKHYLFTKESYFQYLKNRGVNPKDIEQAVKNIQ